MLVPTGVRRVGTTIESNDKRKGVSLMLAAYIRKEDDSDALTSGILPPFIVFNGKAGATLYKRYSDWSRREGHSGSMNFQSKHWFDGVITLRWINWLNQQFPTNLKIGLIWDAAPQHLGSIVGSRLKELEESRRLFTAVIPSGLTSVLQLGV